jgi:hypothetical protein
MCSEYEDFSDTEEIMNGTLYYKGKPIDIDEYCKGNIQEKEQKAAQEIAFGFDALL